MGGGKSHGLISFFFLSLPWYLFTCVVLVCLAHCRLRWWRSRPFATVASWSWSSSSSLLLLLLLFSYLLLLLLLHWWDEVRRRREGGTRPNSQSTFKWVSRIEAVAAAVSFLFFPPATCFTYFIYIVFFFLLLPLSSRTRIPVQSVGQWPADQSTDRERGSFFFFPLFACTFKVGVGVSWREGGRGGDIFIVISKERRGGGHYSFIHSLECQNRICCN